MCGTLVGMTTPVLLSHERVDDIPLLIGFLQRLRLAEVIDQHVREHGHHQGLSTGWLVTVWLAYILSEGDHRKSSVQEWVGQRHHTLHSLLGQAVRPTDFTDDRLGLVLRRLSQPDVWAEIEAELWQATLGVYALELTSVRLDSTTSYGYHQVQPDGIMQHGQSKDHRPDLPQVKLMVAAAEPTGQVIACDVHGGQAADDPLYVPLLRRVWSVLAQVGLLYVGDAKMSALGTRATIVAHQDYYLTVLSARSEARHAIAGWIENAIEGEPTLALLWGAEELLGAGYEVTRPLVADGEATGCAWNERVLVVRSAAFAKEGQTDLAQRLTTAAAEVARLTPLPGRGKRAFRDEASLRAAVEAVLQRHEVVGLLQVAWRRDEQSVTRYVGRGPAGPNRPTRTDVSIRYFITTVQRDEAAIAARIARLGWRIYVTNAPPERLSLAQAVRHYRGGWCLERGFHLVKDRPLGISPLFVTRDEQIIGLTHLLTLGWRVLILLESQARRGLAEAKARLTGLYEGQPKRVTDQPTGTRLLKAFARAQVTLIGLQSGDTQSWHLTPLPPLLLQILTHLGLSAALYTRLTENSP